MAIGVETPLDEKKTPSCVFSLRKQNLKEKCWAILALLGVGVLRKGAMYASGQHWFSNERNSETASQ